MNQEKLLKLLVKASLCLGMLALDAYALSIEKFDGLGLGCLFIFTAIFIFVILFNDIA